MTITPISILLFLATVCVRAAEPQRITVDFAHAQGELRALHGINKGPLAATGFVDVTEDQKRLRLPSTRLHDCHYPNPTVVDLHAVFPDPEADPSLPASYDFRATDEYIAAIRATGAEIVYRLGESIEWQTVKRYVHPPRDPARWAAACAGIVRHYNEGWANGFRYGIRYWEIWNEPENRPVMWTGTDAQFLELYRVTARTLRKEFAGIKIGGPGMGYYGTFDGTLLQPSEFCLAFLDQCQRESLPLDFFSWHCYTDNPAELVARARAVRRLLDTHGFTQTESHLNEWNYLPDNQWDVLKKQAPPTMRQRAADRMTGAEGGTFLVAALIELQDAPLTLCNFYHGETGVFGLFTEVGAPQWTYYAMLSFVQLLETPKRVRVTGAQAGKLSLAAGVGEKGDVAALLVANLTGPTEVALVFTNLPWTGTTTVEISRVDGGAAPKPPSREHLASQELLLNLAPPCVARITLRPKSPSTR